MTHHRIDLRTPAASAPSAGPSAVRPGEMSSVCSRRRRTTPSVNSRFSSVTTARTAGADRVWATGQFFSER